MIRKAVSIFILLSMIPIIMVVYKGYDYYHYRDFVKSKEIEIHKKLEYINKEIEDKKEEKKHIEVSDSEEIGVLELWKKRIEDLKENL